MKLGPTKLCRLGSLFASGIFFVVAIAIICWQAVRRPNLERAVLTILKSYTNRPGPNYYYSHFSGLQLACVLAFDALQVLRFIQQSHKRDPCLRSRLHRFFTNIYWAVLGVSGLACAISYGLTPKTDATAMQVLIFLNSIVALTKIVVDRVSVKALDTKTMTDLGQKQPTPLWRFLYASGRNVNRLLKFVRFVLSILFIVGAVQLARQYRFKNP